MNTFTTWLAGGIAAAVIALTARRLGVLTRHGAVAAWAAGTIAMAAGWRWGILLVVYFVSSSILSRYRAAEKAIRVDGRMAKPGARDAVQVAANGGLFVGAALAHAIHPAAAWQYLGIGALAASAADTWATEIGSLARGVPRSIVSGAPVPIGSSGGVTTAGFAAAALAALFVALLARLVGWPPEAGIAAMVGGLAGCVVDSLLGATVQARYWCASCGSDTEQRRHDCGARTLARRGWPWLDNDAVNALATATGAAVGIGAAALSR